MEALPRRRDSAHTENDLVRAFDDYHGHRRELIFDMPRQEECDNGMQKVPMQDAHQTLRQLDCHRRLFHLSWLLVHLFGTGKLLRGVPWVGRGAATCLITRGSNPPERA